MTERESAARGQLPLTLQPRDDATLENFLQTPRNAAALDALRDGGEDLVYLHGPADGGKSHLLQALCNDAAGPALYLPAAEVAAFAADEVVGGIEGLALVCIDGLDGLVGRDGWERALFHLYNRARQHRCRLRVAATRPPATLAVTLPDLRSRLAAGLVFALPGPTDRERREILRFRADRRGMALSPGVADYILARAPRGLGELLALLDHLDRASLAAQRPLTQPFVRGVLGW